MATTLRKDHNRKFYRLRLRKRTRERYVEILKKFRLNRTKKVSWRHFQRWMVDRSLRKRTNIEKWWAFTKIGLKDCSAIHSIIAKFNSFGESLWKSFLSQYGTWDMTNEQLARWSKLGLNSTRSKCLFPRDFDRERKARELVESSCMHTCVCTYEERRRMAGVARARMAQAIAGREPRGSCPACKELHVTLGKVLSNTQRLQFMAQSCTASNCSNFMSGRAAYTSLPVGQGRVDYDLVYPVHQYLEGSQGERTTLDRVSLRSLVRRVKVITPIRWATEAASGLSMDTVDAYSLFASTEGVAYCDLFNL